MKIFKILILFIVSCFCFNLACLADSSIPVKLVKILDGDTVVLEIDDNQFSVRLQGIDCYETSRIHRAYKQAYNDNIKVDDVVKKGNDAKYYLEDLYKKSNKEVLLDFKGLDIYKRVLGIVYFDNLNVNEELIRSKKCAVYNYKR